MATFDEYSRLEIQMIMVGAVHSLKDVLDEKRPGSFDLTSLDAIKNIVRDFDENGLNAFVKESESYDYHQLKTIFDLSQKWMSLLGLELPEPTQSIIGYHTGPYGQNPVDPIDAFLDNLVIDVDEKQDVLPSNEKRQQLLAFNRRWLS